MRFNISNKSKLTPQNFSFHYISDTLWLGTRNRFNDQLNGTTARYTYFVPRDKAWKSLENEFPSVYKKLFMPDFSYHVSVPSLTFIFMINVIGCPIMLYYVIYVMLQANAILERHLIVSDRIFTMGDLKNMSVATDALILTPVRDQLKIRVTEHDKREYIYFLARFSFVFPSFIVFSKNILYTLFFFCFTELYSLLTYSYLNVTQIDFYSFVLFLLLLFILNFV